jgi:hypothetical protein
MTPYPAAAGRYARHGRGTEAVRIECMNVGEALPGRAARAYPMGLLADSGASGSRCPARRPRRQLGANPTSATPPPDSAAFNTPMSCSSSNRLLPSALLAPVQPEDSQLNWTGSQGQVSRTGR